MQCDPSMAFLLTTCKKRCLFLLLQLLRRENGHLKPSAANFEGYSACVEHVTPSCLNQILVLVYFSPVCIFKVGFVAHALAAPQEWQISGLSSIAQTSGQRSVGAIQAGNV